MFFFLISIFFSLIYCQTLDYNQGLFVKNLLTQLCVNSRPADEQCNVQNLICQPPTMVCAYSSSTYSVVEL